MVETEFGPVHVISIEDIILDRLDGYRWTNRKDDYLWAKVIFDTGLKNSTPIDLAYLEAEARERDIEPALKKLFSETNIEPPSEGITDNEEFDRGFGNR